MDNKLFSTLFLLVILMGLIFILNPQKSFAQDSLPSVEEVLENYINALGGREAIEKLTTRTCTGYLIKDVLWEDPPYDVIPFTAYAKVPNKVMITYQEPSGEESTGFDGVVGWRKNSDGVYNDESIGKPKLSFILNPQNALNIRIFYKGLKITEIDVVNGQRAYVLESEELTKGNYALYFDIETGLLVRIGYHWELHDYREKDDVMFPFRILQGGKGGLYTYKFDEVKHNEQIDDNLFEKPSFKGMELYSYTEDGKNITYALLIGTNRLKLPEEIIGSSIEIEELIGQIKKLASGETIFWVNDRLSGKLNNNIKFIYPDEQTIENIKSVCKKYNITLHIESMDNEKN
ncbi:MAG: hypothetical protein KAU01_05770 [Candidatus Cloacimonetes bacterium]|nr:hypothetical protein [Candidatus Cloacimonadota bacterium]